MSRFAESEFAAKAAIEAANTHAALRGVLLGVARSKAGDISPERLGRYLKANLNRVVGGLRLVLGGDAHTKTSGYVIKALESSPPRASDTNRGAPAVGCG